MTLEEVVVLERLFPIPHKPHNIPGILKSKKPRQALHQPKPFVFSFVAVSVTICEVILLLPYLGQIINGFLLMYGWLPGESRGKRV